MKNWDKYIRCWRQRDSSQGQNFDPKSYNEDLNCRDGWRRPGYGRNYQGAKMRLCDLVDVGSLGREDC